MRITNITDFARNTGVKVIGIGEYRIMPGETVEVPDSICYYTDGGKKKVIGSIEALRRTNQIRYEEGPAPVAAPDPEPQSSDGAPAGDGGSDETGGEDEKPAAPELTDEEKKALAAKKRAEARAAKKAAEEAAKSAGKSE